MISKSITQPRYSIIGTFLYSIIVMVLIRDVTPEPDKKYKQMEVLDDLPLKEDLEKYLTGLEKIVSFVDQKKLYIDMNFGFGLFLISVNLNTLFELKGNNLPPDTKGRMAKMLLMNDDLMKYFQQMVERYTEQSNSDAPVRYITELFASARTIWTNHLQRFRTDLLKITKFHTRRELQQIYLKWPIYMDKVYDFDSYSPSPGSSDSCISALSRSVPNNDMHWVKCKVNMPCSKIILNGTDFGYGITHRLMYLLMARFARGCTIISGAEDKYYIDKLCAKIYNEAEYISQNKFEINDLSMEQISLCTLEGHAQFVRRSWIDDLLEFQTDLGCFATSIEDKDTPPPPNIYETERPQWDLVHDEQEILGGLCNSHTSGVAAGTLSAAVRYVIEKYY